MSVTVEIESAQTTSPAQLRTLAASQNWSDYRERAYRVGGEFAKIGRASCRERVSECV